MKTLRSWFITAAALAALTACGGSDPHVPGSGAPAGAPTTKGAFTAVVSFGDSLSDVGTYKPATSLVGGGAAPYFGGRFTTNATTDAIEVGAPAGVWVENLAGALGLVVTPAEFGFGGSSVKCPAAAVPALATTCTGYGQGGARVTDPNGIGKAGGALTVPVKTQIANHLAAFGGFTANDLIFVWAGANDVFVQFGAFAAQAAQIQADAAAGRLTPDQANGLLLQAQLAAQEGMKQAALELGSYVNDEILAKGGVYVAVMNLPDIADTPFGQAVPANARPVLSGLSENFNLWLREALTGKPVLWIDTLSLFKDVVGNPANYGFSNVSIPACDAAKISVVTGGAVSDGSSLFCNATPGVPYNGLRDGADTTTWAFADSVHPTTGGHAVLAGAFAQQLRSSGWID